MNKTSLEIMYENLISSLWEELVFYIPDNEILNKFLENHKEIKIEKFRNAVLVIDYNKGPIIYKMDRENSKILFKGGTLKKGIYRLLNNKANSNEQEFNYILELYYEQAECLHFITKWLKDNIQQILPQEDTIIGLFKIQSENYKEHFDTLIRQLYPDRRLLPKGKFDIGKSMEFSYSRISKIYGIKDKPVATSKTLGLQDNQIESASTPSNSKTRTKRVKKQPIISDSEAETILLKRIFNIKK